MHVVVLDPGEEAVQSLTRFASESAVAAGQLTGVGGFERATLGWFDRQRKEYQPIPLDEQAEVLSLVGDIAGSAGGPIVHVHAVLGLRDGSTRGGHLLSGVVWPTLEVMVQEPPAALRKRDRPDLGIAVIDVDASPRGQQA